MFSVSRAQLHVFTWESPMARGAWCARPLVLATAALSLVSCGSDPTEPRRVPASIVILPNAPTLSQKASKQLTATVVDAAGREIADEAVTFESSDTTILTVSPTGLLLSIGPIGTATITVRDGELSGSVDAVVTLLPSTITVSPNPVALQTGFSLQLSVMVTDANGEPILNPTVTFTSSNPGLVTVTEYGYLTSVAGNGTATLTVGSGTLSTTVPVTVTQVPTTIQVSPTSMVLSSGQSQSITATVKDAAGGQIVGAPLSYVSSNASVATVSSAGVVTAVGPDGGATITVTSGTLTATVGVFVGEAPPGTVLATVPVGGSPWGVAVTATGDFFVTTILGTIERGAFPTYAFPTTIPVNGQALSIAVNAAGTTAYVAQGADGGGTTGIAVVNLATNTVTDIIPIPNVTSFCVTLSKDEHTLFVGTNDKLQVIDVPSKTIVNDNLAVGGANAISRAPGSDLLYAAINGAVIEINGTTRAIVRTFAVPSGSLQETAASLDGTELYVAQEGGDLIVWDLTTNQLKQTVTGAGGFGLGLSPDGKFLYEATSYGGEIRVIDRASRVVLRTIATGGTPRRVAFDPTSGIAMVTNENGWVDFVK
jgi:YVTN family beta-propeller protein